MEYDYNISTHFNEGEFFIRTDFGFWKVTDPDGDDVLQLYHANRFNYLLTDEEMSVMYWQKDKEKNKNFRSTDTFVCFDFPKSYSKFIMICKVVDELIEKAYGAFKEPSDIRIGCMNGDETFVHMTFPIGIFSQMYDCSDEEELEELKGNESGIYMFFYKKIFGNITIEEIWDKERQYMRDRIKKNDEFKRSCH